MPEIDDDDLNDASLYYWKFLYRVKPMINMEAKSSNFADWQCGLATKISWKLRVTSSWMTGDVYSVCMVNNMSTDALVTKESGHQQQWHSFSRNICLRNKRVTSFYFQFVRKCVLCAAARLNIKMSSYQYWNTMHYKYHDRPIFIMTIPIT